MRSNPRFYFLLSALVLIAAGLLFWGFRTDERFAQLETMRRAPTAPPLQELLDGIRHEASGRTVYVPVYSHIYGRGGVEQLLEVTLSVRNTDLEQPIAVRSIRYFDTEGKLLKDYLEKPVALGPLASTDFLVEQRDTAGGTGANFLVEWSAGAVVSEPLVEAVMVGHDGHQAFAFVRPGYPLSGPSESVED